MFEFDIFVLVYWIISVSEIIKFLVDFADLFKCLVHFSGVFFGFCPEMLRKFTGIVLYYKPRGQEEEG